MGLLVLQALALRTSPLGPKEPRYHHGAPDQEEQDCRKITLEPEDVFHLFSSGLVVSMCGARATPLAWRPGAFFGNPGAFLCFPLLGRLCLSLGFISVSSAFPKACSVRARSPAPAKRPTRW